jgi:6-phosphogluconolactonase
MTSRTCAILVSVAAILISSLGSSCGGGSSGSLVNNNPVLPPNAIPTISIVTPSNATAGGTNFTITVTGTSFVSTSTVNWNGTALASIEMGGTECTATVPAADIVAAGAAQITVVNPAPGGGTSNSLAFVINGTGAAVTPGYVYVANGIGVSLTMGNISAFSIDPNTGVLTPAPGSPFEAGAEPTSVTVDPSNKFLYEASNLDNVTPTNDITAFTIDPSTGALSPVPGSPFTSGVSPLSVSVDSTGKFLYTADAGGEGNGPNESDSISEYSIDTVTGALTPVSQADCVSTSPAIFGLANAVVTDPTAGFLFASSFNGIVCSFSLSPQGILQPVTGSPFSLGTNPLLDPRAVAVDPFGRFVYTANYETSDVSAFSITPGVGALNPVPGSPFSVGASNPPSAVVADPLGRFLYVLDFNVGISGFSINPNTGALTMLPGFPISLPIFSPSPLAVDPSGKFLYVGTGLSYESPSVYAFAINETTGALTSVPGSPFTVDGTPQAITVTRKVP